AEDGIRDFHVTGVQTCALPIYQMADTWTGKLANLHDNVGMIMQSMTEPLFEFAKSGLDVANSFLEHFDKLHQEGAGIFKATFGALKSTISDYLGPRSEERRVGKECRSRGGRCQ